MSNVPIGTLIEGEAGRDAIHVAIAPVEAAHRLRPGERVGFIEGGNTTLVGESDEPVGIVDPFLTHAVTRGQRFYLFLFPNTVTSLRHVWTHPAFPNEGCEPTPAPDKAASEAWLFNFCITNDCPAWPTVRDAIEGRGGGGGYSAWDDDYLHFDGEDAHGDIPDEFWRHAEIVIGRPLRRAKHFFCSC